MTTSPFPILRQVALGTADFAGDGDRLRELFGLAPGYTDPMLEDVGMADETLPVGDVAYLELVAPLNEKAPINGWLAKVGGTAGYCASIQVSNLTPHLAAAEAAGVRIAVDLDVHGKRIIQFHPGDMGLLLELDEIPDPQAWHWDDVDFETPAEPLIGDVVGIDVATADPVARAELWAAVLGVELDEWDDVPLVRLGERTVRFVKDDVARLSAIDVVATPAGQSLPDEIDFGQVTFRVQHA
ncbi:hypothetical protein [Aeromicrobium duanguangcaii]|uniref:hypothetical protein n=1 Tax=Aeromicrobium duanguangcaii TaxID=2968086 RepID=UPI0020174305|nr:hypothetical protein [Aeromicrobium duanguangcaii]MCL3837591.1 hypothetical protein [Aeromicrobium duanguangcaii]